MLLHIPKQAYEELDELFNGIRKCTVELCAKYLILYSLSLLAVCNEKEKNK